ncbi:MAG: hypothetical protein O7F76_14280, partial [Planctomycetota bacterium]|nr:hypothetical protein [Planctomycetota bacterium]
AERGGLQIGPLVEHLDHAVTDGLFTVQLDFTVEPYTNDNSEARWLEIEVRSPAGVGGFTRLDDRQKLMPTPFSLATRGVHVDADGKVGIGGMPDPLSSAILQVIGGRGRFKDGIFSSTIDSIGGQSLTLQDTMTIDTSGNVGIGVKAPAAKLHVMGKLKVGNSIEIGGESGTDDTIISTAGTIDFVDSGLVTTGNVGIGTTNPAAKLHVVGNEILTEDYRSPAGLVGRRANGTSAAPTRVGTNDSLVLIGGGGYDGTAFSPPEGAIEILAAEPWESGEHGTFMRFNTTANGGTSTRERMRISHDGNVGIGAFGPPLHPLDVRSSAIVTINGESSVFSGTGVRGWHTAPSGIGWGVIGRTNSSDGFGVLGWHTNPTGTAPAVNGITHSGSRNAAGVTGTVNDTTPGSFSAGVRGVNNGTGDLGIGVWGSQAGDGWGVYGRVPDGWGVYGEATENSGDNVGVVGRTASPDGWGVFSFGRFGATGAKDFIQPHPTDPSKEIRFVCLEGNESGTYFRGTARLVEGRTVIKVPEEFRLVSETEGVTVQLTPMGPNAGLWVQAKGLDQIVVRGNGEVDFDYFVNGVRRGFADLELIRENHAYVPVERGVPYGTQYLEAHRRILVENGILNPDFTPNEETAALMGWTLKDPVSNDQLENDERGGER